MISEIDSEQLAQKIDVAMGDDTEVGADYSGSKCGKVRGAGGSVDELIYIISVDGAL